MNSSIDPPTRFPQLNRVLDGVVARVQGVLGADFVGLYMQGSIAIGDFDEHSDADFVAVTEHPLTDDRVGELQEMHAQIFDSGEEWAKHLEGSYFPRAVLEDLSRAGEELWYLDNGQRHMQRSDHCNTVAVRWIVRERGVRLAGPDPHTLIGPIPTDVLREEIRSTIRSWGREILEDPDRYQNRFYQGFIVLNLSRMLHDYIHGSISSKRTGALWARARFDGSWAGLIDRAWGGRPNPARAVQEPADPDDFEATLDYVQLILHDIQRLDSSSGN